MRNIIRKILKESEEFDWIENTLPSLIDEINFALEGSDLKAKLHPTINTIDVTNQYREVVYRVGYDSATSRRPIRTIEEFYQAVKDGFGSSHNARLSIYPNAMDDLETLLGDYIKKILRESDDMDWIRDVTPYISFEDAVEGETYRVGIKNWDRFEEMLEMCSEYDTHVENIVYVNVYRAHELSCDEIYCDECDYWEGKELCLDVIFLDSNKESILSLWMSRDLIQLYAI